MIDKSILGDYLDSCELIKDLERDIRKLQQRSNAASDIVSGSNPEWPYEARHFHVDGVSDNEERIRAETAKLEAARREAARRRDIVETWMLSIPSRMQRIIRYRFFEGFPWEKVADRMGRGATGDSVRKELDKFVKN